MKHTDGVTRLLTILKAEERLYLEMRDLLQRERELILSLDSVGLEQAVREKASLADEGRLLEESRIEVTRELAHELGVGSDRPTLSQLADAVGPNDDGLRQAHSRLAALVGAVKELLDANTVFAGEAQGQVQGTLRLLGRLLPDEPTYGRAGEILEAPSLHGGRLVRQSA